MELTDAEMVTCGIAGAGLIWGLLPYTPKEGEAITYRGLLIIAGVLLGCVMLAFAIWDMVAN